VDGNTVGLPTSILVAMACGGPVVSTPPAAIPEATAAGTSGRLVDEHDATGFAAALRALLADPALTARLGARARETALERFDIVKLHERLEAMILAATAQTG
jgi:glycosyltransferase involved in cell wall biosynthesis